MKKKICAEFKINNDDIIIDFPQEENPIAHLAFINNEFNNLNANDIESKLKNDNNNNNDDEYSEFKNLKSIIEEQLINECILSTNILDPKGNNFNNWGINENRGNKPYDPPLGWIGIGLKVMGLYDKGDNSWISMDNNNSEWCVAYCNIGGKIKKYENKTSRKNIHKDHEDINHAGKTIGEGIFCTPKIKIAENFARIVKIDNKYYKILFMVRVKENAIRQCKHLNDFYVVNGNSEEIRPYRILYKEISKSKIHKSH